MQAIRTAIVGAGKMGGIHARVCSKLADCQLVGIVDVDAARAEKLAKEFNCGAFTDCRALLGMVDAVTIAASTPQHYQLAKLFIENQIPVMIEKPLAASVEEARAIVELGRKHGVVVAVGHSERCNPVVQAMKRLKIEPKFIEAVRISPFPFRSMEVSVVLDVMIHDIDIVLSLANSPIASVDAVGVNVIADHEDICSARIRFANGCVANITASRLAMKTERKIRVFSRQAYLSLDFLKKEGTIIKADPNVDVVRWIQEQRNNPEADFAGVNWTELLHIENLSIENNEPLRVEQEAFLNAVRGTAARPEVTAEEGLAAMECAEKILASVREHKWE